MIRLTCWQNNQPYWDERVECSYWCAQHLKQFQEFGSMLLSMIISAPTPSASVTAFSFWTETVTFLTLFSSRQRLPIFSTKVSTKLKCPEFSNLWILAIISS